MGRVEAQPSPMPTRIPWALAGMFAGLVGLGVTSAITWIFTLSDSVMLQVAGIARHLVPARAHESAEKYLGLADRAVFIGLLVAAGLLVCGYAGMAARRRWWEGAAILILLAGVPVFAVLSEPAAGAGDLVPVLSGLVAAWGTLGLLGRLLNRHPEAFRRGSGDPPVADGAAGAGRRLILGSAAAVGLSTLVGVVVGHRVGVRRRKVAASRNLLRISEITQGTVPRGARVGAEGISAWRTPTADFFVRDTVLQVPTIEPDEWQLRIHGLVEREVTLSYADLVAMPLAEAWITLGCRRNEVGGDQIGNAWWSGVRVADVLARAGVLPQADSVVQTSHDGWRCLTPLAVLTDSREALFAFGMNGAPLTLEHGFPVRTVVPGVFGDAAACKWVVDVKVTRAASVEDQADSISASDGVSALSLASRIDVPAEGASITLEAGSREVTVAGMAWASRTGVGAVEVSLDGGEWRRVTVARPGVSDTWLQWATTVTAEPGSHQVRVRAVDGDGRTQEAVQRGVEPGPASGWHSVRFEVTAWVAEPATGSGD